MFCAILSKKYLIEMKKIALFMAVAATVLASCSDDDNTTSNPLNRTYLDGVWVESAPDANKHKLAFDADSVTLTRQESIVGNYDYEISGNRLLFTLKNSTTATPTEHTVQIVNDSVMKVSNLVVGPANGTTPAVPVTFKKLND
jgi:hypothetical protein